MPQHRSADAVPGHPRAVGAVEVAQLDPVGIDGQLGVMARNGRLDHLQGIAGLAPDGERGAGRDVQGDGLALALTGVEAQGVAGIHGASRRASSGGKARPHPGTGTRGVGGDDAARGAGARRGGPSAVAGAGNARHGSGSAG